MPCSSWSWEGTGVASCTGRLPGERAGFTAVVASMLVRKRWLGSQLTQLWVHGRLAFLLWQKEKTKKCNFRLLMETWRFFGCWCCRTALYLGSTVSSVEWRGKAVQAAKCTAQSRCCYAAVAVESWSVHSIHANVSKKADQAWWANREQSWAHATHLLGLLVGAKCDGLPLGLL